MKKYGWLGLFCAILTFFAMVSWGCQYVSGGGAEEEVGRVTFLDVGQGLSVLLEYGGRYALYDSGPDSANFIEKLRDHGVDSLDWVLLSHNHRDHLGGLLELLADPSAPSRDLSSGPSDNSRSGPSDNSRSVSSVNSRSVSSDGRRAIQVGRLMVGPDTSGGILVDSVLRSARRRGIPIDTLHRGDQVSLGKVLLTVLWPVEYLQVGENGASVVLRGRLVDDGSGESAGNVGVSAGGTDEGSFLLTGDLDSLGECRLLEVTSDVSADLLQVGHHGSVHSSTLRFLSGVSPRYAVISVGTRNSYGHPAEPVLRKLQYVLGSAAISNSATPSADATISAADTATSPDSADAEISATTSNSADVTNLFRTDREGDVTFMLVPGVGVVP